MNKSNSPKYTSKFARRTFNLQIGLQMEHRQWTHEVLDAIENDTVLVFDLDDDDALGSALDAQGREIINAGAKIPVSIREWLPVACQYIHFDQPIRRSKAKSKDALLFTVITRVRSCSLLPCGV
jgi:hypothetical protein